MRRRMKRCTGVRLVLGVPPHPLPSWLGSPAVGFAVHEGWVGLPMQRRAIILPRYRRRVGLFSIVSISAGLQHPMDGFIANCALQVQEKG